MKTYYVTTPIYYVNDVPHIGHAYTTIAADVLARFKRLDGYDVFFLTGTDEHGQKIQKAAENAKETPIQLADRVVSRFQALWEKLDISHDDFIRTTEERHKKVVNRMIEKLLTQEDIYLGTYEDWYCVDCEAYLTETQLVNGLCPIHSNKKPEKLKEESYFFKMSKYERPLLKYIEEHPDFIQPETRKNEIVSFIREGLRDLSISRTSFSWGIPMPETKQTTKKHVVYVWFDALLNYISALGYLDDPQKFQKYWQQAIHLIGKDILRFHAVYWPTFLMALKLPLPKKIFAHGWWTLEGQKISKSLGNAIDPTEIVNEFGLDPFRYFILREVPFGVDGDFSKKALIHRINSDLANDLGNLLFRSLNMVQKYCQENLKEGPLGAQEVDKKLYLQIHATLADIRQALDEINFTKALQSLWGLIGAANKYIDQQAPWTLAKQEKDRERLCEVLRGILYTTEMIAAFLYPFMPTTSQKIWTQLGLQTEISHQNIDVLMKQKNFGYAIAMGEPLFPRIEV